MAITQAWKKSYEKHFWLRFSIFSMSMLNFFSYSMVCCQNNHNDVGIINSDVAPRGSIISGKY